MSTEESQQKSVYNFTFQVNKEDIHGYAILLSGCVWIYVGRGALTSLHLTHFPRTTPIIYAPETDTMDKAIALRLGKLFPQKQVFFSTDMSGGNSEDWKLVYDGLAASLKTNGIC